MSLVAEPFRSPVRVLVLFLLASLPPAVQAQSAGQLPLSDPRAFEGRWIASGYTCRGNEPDQVVEITYSVWSGLEARKISGDSDCVRAGEIAWRNGRLIGRVIHVEFHFRKPGGSAWDSEWRAGSLEIISRDEIVGFGVTFRRGTPQEVADPSESVVDLSGDWETREVPNALSPHPGRIRITQQGDQIVATWVGAPAAKEFPLGGERYYTGQEAFRGRIRGRQVIGTGVVYAFNPDCDKGAFDFSARLVLDIGQDGAALEGHLQSDQTYVVFADSERRPTGECRQVTVGYEKGLGLAFRLVREGPPPPTAIRFSERVERGRLQRVMTLVPGREFFVEAAYDNPPAADEVTATLEWHGSPATEIQLRRSPTSTRLYLSAPLVVATDESGSHPPTADEAAFLAGEWNVAHTDTDGTVVPGTAVVESAEGTPTVRYRLGDPAQGEQRELTSRDVRVRGDYVEMRFASSEASSGTAPSSSSAVIRIEAPAGTTVQASLRGVTTAATIGSAEPDPGVLTLRFPLPLSAAPPERLTGGWSYATRGSGDDGARSGFGRESWTRIRRGTLASLRFIELDGHKAYEIDELLNGVPFYLEATYQSPPSEAEADARLTWEGGAASITLARDTLERYRSGPLVVPAEPGGAPAPGASSPVEIAVAGETLVTATLLDKQATARTQPAVDVAGISFRDHLGNTLPERVENGVLKPAQIQTGEPYVGVIEYESEPNQDEQPVTVAVRDQVSREKATRTEANAAVFETEPRRAVKVGDIVTLYAHGQANQLEVVPPRIEVFVRRPGRRHTRTNVPSLTTDETFFVDVFVPPQEAVKIGDTLRVQFLAKEKGATASLQLRDSAASAVRRFTRTTIPSPSSKAAPARADRKACSDTCSPAAST